VSRRALWHDPPGVEQGQGDEGAEGEAADVREEGDAPAVRRCRGEAGVTLDELVDEPAAEVEPGRDLDEEESTSVRMRALG
jgi:hypothetical protein